jgi:hypothetical protein
VRNNGKRIVFGAARRGNYGKRNVFKLPALKAAEKKIKQTGGHRRPVVFFEPKPFFH